MTTKERYGLVLGGGGLRGAYEVGVWQALQELEIQIGGVSGTSIGALNGAMIVQNEYEKLYELYQELKISQMIEIKAAIDPEKDFFSISNLQPLLKELIINRGFDNTPLRKLVEQYLDINKVYESKMDFGVVTYSLRDFKPAELFKEDIEPELLVDYLLASACFPIFKAQKIKDKKYIDGCIYDSMPINMLSRKGYKHIIAVDLDTYTPLRKPHRRDIYVKVITPREDLGGTFEFNPQRIKHNIKLGYLDAMRSFCHYQGHEYYFSRSQFAHLLVHFELQTIYGLEFAAQVYNLPKIHVYEANEFLEHLYHKHLDAKKRYKELLSQFHFDELGRRSQLLNSLIRKGLAICWFEEMFTSRPLARHSLLARTFNSYATAATSMLELEHYHNSARIHTSIAENA